MSYGGGSVVVNSLLPPVCVCVSVCVCVCVRGRYYVLHYFVSSFAIISMGKKLSWLLYFNCLLMSFDS